MFHTLESCILYWLIQMPHVTRITLYILNIFCYLNLAPYILHLNSLRFWKAVSFHYADSVVCLPSFSSCCCYVPLFL
jgi:hypothetical protein